MSETMQQPAREKLSGKMILVLVLSTAIMVGAGFANFKFPPILTDLMARYGVEMGTMGIVTSVFQWIGIIVTLPVGIFLSRYSPKITGFLGAIAIVIGNVVAMAAGSIPLLVVGRIFEGLGYSILQVLTQSLVTSTYRNSSFAGSATGILNIGMLIGQIVHFNLAPRVVLAVGLNGVYWYIIGVVAVLAVLWLILINSDMAGKKDDSQQLTRGERMHKIASVFKSRDMWLVILAFSIIRLAVVNTGTFIPTYISVSRDMTMVEASGLFSIATTIGTFALIGYGMISDALHTRRKVIIFSCFSAIAVFFLLMKLPAHLLIIFIILYGSVDRGFSPITFSCYGDIFEDKSLIPVAHSMVHTVANIFTAVGTIIYGYVIQYLGYDALWILVMCEAAIAGILWIFVKKVK